MNSFGCLFASAREVGRKRVLTRKQRRNKTLVRCCQNSLSRFIPQVHIHSLLLLRLAYHRNEFFHVRNRWHGCGCYRFESKLVLFGRLAGDNVIQSIDKTERKIRKRRVLFAPRTQNGKRVRQLDAERTGQGIRCWCRHRCCGVVSVSGSPLLPRGSVFDHFVDITVIDVPFVFVEVLPAIVLVRRKRPRREEPTGTRQGVAV